MAAVIGEVSAGIALLDALITEAQKISSLIVTQTNAGQSTFTAEQWASITGADDSAEVALQKAIDAAKAAGK